MDKTTSTERKVFTQKIYIQENYSYGSFGRTSRITPLIQENFGCGKQCNYVTTCIQQPLNRTFMTKYAYKISTSCLMPILLQNKMLKSKFLLLNTQCKFELNNEMQLTVQTGINGRLL